MKAHPIAEIWPMMDAASLEELAKDIKDQGQLQPIWTYEGMVLDGRNRLAACEQLGLKPKVSEYKGESPIAFAYAMNSKRRHLNTGQKAAVGAQLVPLLEEEAKKRRREGGRKGGQAERGKLHEKVREARKHTEQVSDEAAKIAKSNAKYVEIAVNIQKKAPEVFEELKAGSITIMAARTKANRLPEDDNWLPDEEQRKLAVERGESVVANFERDKHLIQWAEEKDLLVKIDRGSKWGNPFELEKDGTRDEVCDHYVKFYLPHKPSLLKAMDNLRGQVLACHCFPERCHGDALLKRLEG